MRNIIGVFIALSISFSTWALDTLRVSSKPIDVTVYYDGAQITRAVKSNLKPGKYVLIAEKLPAEINPKSLQVKSLEKVKIISVKHALIPPSEKSDAIQSYEKKIKHEEYRIKGLQQQIQVFELEEKILLENSNLGGKSRGASIEDIKEAASFYRSKLNEIKEHKLKLSLEVFEINEDIQSLYMELNQKVATDQKTFSQVTWVVEIPKTGSFGFEMSYFVPSAGWKPLYDFRVADIENPMELVYNAHIFQSTGEDWKNVNLTLSTNLPTQNNEKPELQTWFLNRRQTIAAKPSYDGTGSLKGKVIDAETGEPLPFANIVVLENGNQITGATTDFDGMYSIRPVKAGRFDVQVSYIGYQSTKVKQVHINANKVTFLDINLESSGPMLDEFEVVQYTVPLIDKDGGASGATITSQDINRMPARTANSLASTVGGVYKPEEKSIAFVSNGYASSSNVNSLEYVIDIPYSIPSDGQNYNVKIKDVQVPLQYAYYCTPKIDPTVYLVAEIQNWNQLDLLSGESSIYYNGTFSGQSSIDAEVTTDTLQIALNRDKDIVVTRTLLKDRNERQVLGSNIRETINWSIVVKNNKSKPVKVIIDDQYPISEQKSVSIQRLEHEGATLDGKTGKLVWNLNIPPNGKQELFFAYSIKYPKYMQITVH